MRVIPAVAPVFRYSGLDRLLARRRNFWVRHVWSLFALYDVRRMVLLDNPWWVYDVTSEVERFLEERDGKARVFEFGAGASTVWLGKRAGEVHSVEHDGEFVEALRPMVAAMDNVELHHVAPAPRRPDSTAVSEHEGWEHYDFADYVSTIDAVGGVFDLIVIDGRSRPACLAAAVGHLAAPDGLLLFDNAAREHYAAALGACGLEVDLRKGRAPSLPWRETTALLRRSAGDPAGTSAGGRGISDSG
jgi:predicted O-methyltransferase YrrM